MYRVHMIDSQLLVSFKVWLHHTIPRKAGGNSNMSGEPMKTFVWPWKTFRKMPTNIYMLNCQALKPHLSSTARDSVALISIRSCLTLTFPTI